MEILSWIAAGIVLLGSVFTAIDKILDAAGKPVLWFKKRHKEEKSFSEKMDSIKKELQEVKEINIEQSEKMKIIEKSNVDLLRKAILDIYHKGKPSKTIGLHDYEYLQDLYKDYQDEGGNAYITKVYHRMEKWEIVDDDD